MKIPDSLLPLAYYVSPKGHYNIHDRSNNTALARTVADMGNAEEFAAYIVHAANNFPALVEALEELLGAVDAEAVVDKHALDGLLAHRARQFNVARAALKKAKSCDECRSYGTCAYLKNMEVD